MSFSSTDIKRIKAKRDRETQKIMNACKYRESRTRIRNALQLSAVIAISLPTIMFLVVFIMKVVGI